MIIKCFYQFVFVTALLVPLISCGGSGATKKPFLDAEAASARAFELFDRNSDSLLDDEELLLAPGLAEGKSRSDTNSDGKISAEELAARIEQWNLATERLVCPELEFWLNGRRVANAMVTFEPEPFLADWLEAKRVRTDELGRCSPQISRELPGMNMGYYRVQVSKSVQGKEQMPATYNEQTQVGVEFCSDRPSEENLLIQIVLGKGKRRR